MHENVWTIWLWSIIEESACLFGFNVTFKHLRTYRDGACLKQWYLTNELAHINAMPQTQDMTPTPSQYTDTGPTCRCVIH